MVNSFFFHVEPEYSRSLSVFRATSALILNWVAPWDVSITPSVWIVGAWPELCISLLLVFRSTQIPTLINGLCFQSTSTVLKIKHKSHWNPTSALCTAHTLQQLSFLTGFLRLLNFSSPSLPLLCSFSHGDVVADFQCRWGRYCLYWSNVMLYGKGANCLFIVPFHQSNSSIQRKSQEKVKNHEVLKMICFHVWFVCELLISFFTLAANTRFTNTYLK